MDESSLTPYPPKIKQAMDREFRNLMNQINNNNNASVTGGKKKLRKTQKKRKQHKK